MERQQREGRRLWCPVQRITSQSKFSTYLYFRTRGQPRCSMLGFGRMLNILDGQPPRLFRSIFQETQEITYSIMSLRRQKTPDDHEKERAPDVFPPLPGGGQAPPRLRVTRTIEQYMDALLKGMERTRQSSWGGVTIADQQPISHDTNAFNQPRALPFYSPYYQLPPNSMGMSDAPLDATSWNQAPTFQLSALRATADQTQTYPDLTLQFVAQAALYPAPLDATSSYQAPSVPASTAEATTYPDPSLQASASQSLPHLAPASPAPFGVAPSVARDAALETGPACFTDYRPDPTRQHASFPQVQGQQQTVQIQQQMVPQGQQQPLGIQQQMVPQGQQQPLGIQQQMVPQGQQQPLGIQEQMVPHGQQGMQQQQQHWQQARQRQPGQQQAPETKQRLKRGTGRFRCAMCGKYESTIGSIYHPHFVRCIRVRKGCSKYARWDDDPTCWLEGGQGESVPRGTEEMMARFNITPYDWKKNPEGRDTNVKHSKGPGSIISLRRARKLWVGVSCEPYLMMLEIDWFFFRQPSQRHVRVWKETTWMRMVMEDRRQQEGESKQQVERHHFELAATKARTMMETLCLAHAEAANMSVR